jgi:hypothetical protein
LVTIVIGYSSSAVTGGEDQLTLSRLDDVSYWRDYLTIEIYVENGEFKLDRLGKYDCPVNLTSLGYDSVAQFFEHAGDHHPYHHFVFDE